MVNSQVEIGRGTFRPVSLHMCAVRLRSSCLPGLFGPVKSLCSILPEHREQKGQPNWFPLVIFSWSLLTVEVTCSRSLGKKSDGKRCSPCAPPGHRMRRHGFWIQRLEDAGGKIPNDSNHDTKQQPPSKCQDVPSRLGQQVSQIIMNLQGWSCRSKLHHVWHDSDV